MMSQDISGTIQSNVLSHFIQSPLHIIQHQPHTLELVGQVLVVELPLMRQPVLQFLNLLLHFVYVI